MIPIRPVRRLPGITRVSRAARVAAINAFFPEGRPRSLSLAEHPTYHEKCCPIGYAFYTDDDNERLLHRWMMAVPNHHAACACTGVQSSRANYIAYQAFMYRNDHDSLTKTEALTAFALTEADLA